MQVRCFGKFKVIAGSGEVKFRTSKAEELLAYLIDGRGSKRTPGAIQPVPPGTRKSGSRRTLGMDINACL